MTGKEFGVFYAAPDDLPKFLAVLAAARWEKLGEIPQADGLVRIAAVRETIKITREA